MRRAFQALVLAFVVANIALLAWLLVRSPSGEEPRRLADVVEPLVDDGAMQAARYDLHDPERLNVILISLDALRYDRTGLGGNDRGLTPNLDAFAREAVVFHDAVAASSWTLPSHMSVWTARWPTVHGVTNKLRLLSSDQMVESTLSPGVVTFPDRLIQEGFVAAAFTGGAGVQAKYGFGRGFDTYQDDRYFAGLDYGIPAALDWVRSHRDQRFFLFLHGYDAHGQYELPEAERARIPYDGELDGSKEEQARLREQGLAAIKEPGDPPSLRGVLDEEDARFLAAVYDLKVRAADQRLGSFLDEIRRMGLLDRSIVVIMSDHGDEFMEHGHIDHGHSLYQELLHVVLLIRFPGYARRHDVREMVRLVDVMPTVFDALGLQGVDGVDGRSLMPLLRGQPWKVDAFAETDYRLFVHLRMLRQGPYKLILDLQDGERNLYDLSKDPGEQHDISSAEPRRTYEMEQDLRERLHAMGTNPQDYLGLRQKPIELF